MKKSFPVYDQGDWHVLHARKDCCAQCHGGNCSSMDKDLAHEGMVANPLEDIYTNCYHCHPDDYQAAPSDLRLPWASYPAAAPLPLR